MVCLFGKKEERVQSDGLGIGRVQSDGLGIGRVQKGYRKDTELKRGDLSIQSKLDIILRFGIFHTIVQPPKHHKKPPISIPPHPLIPPFSFQTNNSRLIKIHKTRHIVSQLHLQLLVIRETSHIFHNLNHPRHNLLHLLPRQRSRHPLPIIPRMLAYQIIPVRKELLHESFERFIGVPVPHQRHYRELKVGQIVRFLLRNHASNLLQNDYK